MLAGLARSQVAAHAGAFRARERRLDHQQIGSARELDHVLVWRRVRAIREPAAAVLRRVDLQRERLREMRDVRELDRERPDLWLVVDHVLLELEGVLDQVVVAPGADDRPEHLAAAGRTDQAWLAWGGVAGPALDRYRLALRRVRQRVRVGHQVKEMVRVQMRDDYGVNRAVVAVAA